MEGLYILVCIIGLCVQIFSLIYLKTSKENKYWNLFIGISIANVISVFIAYGVFSDAALGLGNAVLCLLICGFSFFSNLIIFIIGLIVKKNIKDETINLNKSFLLVSVLVVLINVISLLVIPSIVYKIHINSGEKKIVNYLEEKYGDGNYKIVSVYKEYSTKGMWDEYVSGYYYEIESDYMKDTFVVLIDEKLNYIDEDYFLPVYFSQKNNLAYELSYSKSLKELIFDFSAFDNYLLENVKKQFPTASDKVKPRDVYLNYVNAWSSVSGVEYSTNYYIVPNDNGKIPTIEELVEGLIKPNIK